MKPSSPIIVRLLGGRGNQMFQYALGRALSMRWNSRLLLDLHLLHDAKIGRHLVPRRYDLGIFALEAEFASRSDVARYHPFGASMPQKALFHIRQRLLGQAVETEKDYVFDARILDKEPPLYLDGLWQSYRYISAVEPVLRNDLTFRTPLEGEAHEIARRLETPGTVCVHVRRSDYITVASTAEQMGFVGADYYRRAAAAIRAVVSQPRYFVFSDDLPWCRDNLSWLGADTTYLDYDMQIMSHASHFIIANSTYSWWAAWMAEPRSPKIVAPKAWFNAAHLDSRDLIPPHWERV